MAYGQQQQQKCVELFKKKQWFATAVHTPMPTPESDTMYKVGTPLKDGQLPYKVEKDWTDAGWCWIGWGENRIQLRLFVDPGSTCSFSTQGLYDKVAPLAKAGKLGAARIATEVPKITSNAWNGRKDSMGRWMQLTVTANNVTGTQTICIGQFVTFSRVGDAQILVAGKDLARSLGFEMPGDQIKRASIAAITPEMLLGDEPPPRTYVLSNETKRKIEENRKLAELYAKIHSEGLAYVGYEAFKHLRPMQWVQDPTLRHSYMSTAVMHQAGAGANQT